MRVFKTSASWGSFTGVWVTTSLLKTLLSILVDRDNAVVWMVSARPLISESSSPFTKPFRIILSALITIGITVTFMFHSSQAKFKYLSFFDFYSIRRRDGKVHYSARSLSFCFFVVVVDYHKVWRCPWCNGYPRRKWIRRHEFKSWIAFHIALIPLGKVWIQSFSLQLWVNNRTD